MLKLIHKAKFEKDLKLIDKRGKDLRKFNSVIDLLRKEKKLSPKNRNHKLKGNYKGYWECHIEPDWLLIYQKTKIELILVRTGSHSDLF